MPNAVEIICNSCKKKYLISADELMYFGYGECKDCMNPTVRHIRNKIVMGFYDLPEITYAIANKLVESEVLKERRRFPRIEVK